MTMARYLVVVLVVLGLLVTGCAGRKSAPPEAKATAVAFYKNWAWQEDYGAAWDMSIPGAVFPEYKDKADYLARRDVTLNPPKGALQVQEFERVEDYVYLISERTGRWLIWVTKDSGTWKVRRLEHYEGGEIPW